MPKKKEQTRPAQHQKKQPGREHKMRPEPVSEDQHAVSASKLEGKVAIITGGDSGIGKATAIAYAREGANVAIIYLEEDKDAEDTATQVNEEGKNCLLIKGDVQSEEFCRSAVEQTLEEFDQVDVLVNNAAEQHPQQSIADITEEQLTNTFRTNIFAHFFMVKAALPYLTEGASIINTTSVTAYRGSSHLIDYSATKGAIVSFTRSLSKSLASQGIRVNAVAPGAVWTPLIPSTFPKEAVKTFGKDNPMSRPGEPVEIAPSYVFLASDDASFMTGQVLHPNGGEMVGS